MNTVTGTDLASGTFGALGHTAAATFRASTPQVPVRHTHGAGATFSGGLTHAYLTGATAWQAVHTACLAAATDHIPRQRLNSQPIKETPAVTTTAVPPDLFSQLKALDWNDLPAATAESIEVLNNLAANRRLLGELTAAVIDDPHLAGLCEHYDILDKIVLHDDPDGWRLRLHVFLDGYFDRPHNHRWTYTSHILAGSYTHTLYGTDEKFTDTIDVTALTPRLVRIEEPGDAYTLHHSMIHSVTAHGEAVTLIVRGPAVKDRFVVTDRATGKAWWQYGAATETPEAADAKRMSDSQLRDRIAALSASGILA